MTIKAVRIACDVPATEPAASLNSGEPRNGLIDELNPLRFIVEPKVAELAAELETTTEFLRQLDAFEEMNANSVVPERAVEADIPCNLRLCAAAHNKFPFTLPQTVVMVLRVSIELAIKAQSKTIEFLEEHQLVAEAINNKPIEARSRMRNLPRNNERHLIETRNSLSARNFRRN